MICGDIPTYGWVYGWLDGSYEITSNPINLDLIDNSILFADL